MSTNEEMREDARIDALEAKRAAKKDDLALRLCPDCGCHKKASGFRRGPSGDCCAACLRAYLPE